MYIIMYYVLKLHFGAYRAHLSKAPQPGLLTASVPCGVHCCPEVWLAEADLRMPASQMPGSSRETQQQGLPFFTHGHAPAHEFSCLRSLIIGNGDW